MCVKNTGHRSETNLKRKPLLPSSASASTQSSSALTIRAHNKSLDASGGSVFCKLDSSGDASNGFRAPQVSSILGASALSQYRVALESYGDSYGTRTN